MTISRNAVQLGGFIVSGVIILSAFSASAQEQLQDPESSIKSSTIGYEVTVKPATVVEIRWVEVLPDKSIVLDPDTGKPLAVAIRVQFEGGVEKSIIQSGRDTFDIGEKVNVIFAHDGIQIEPAE